MVKTLIKPDSRVFKTVEQGELVGKFDLSANGTTHTYELTFSYAFDYARKDGGLTKFGITRNGNGIIGEGYGKAIEDILNLKFKDDFPEATKEQKDDLVSEAYDLVVDVCNEQGWTFERDKVS